MRMAAIDIGTNSVHMIVTEQRPDGSYRVLDSHKEMVKLGRGEFRARKITADAMTRALSTLVNFKRIAEGHGATRIKAVATSAVREASNGGDFIEAVARESGIRVRVITGEEEGRLIYRAVRHYVDLGDRRVVAVDIGGGSVELVLGVGRRALVVDSVKLGHIRLAEAFEGDPPSAESVTRVRAICRRALKPVLEQYTRKPADLFVGTSGTIEAFARMDLENDKNKNGGEPHLHVLTRDGIEKMTRKLLKADAAERRKLPGLDSGRVETIPAGGIALQEILEGLDAEELTVCTAALREGIILDFLDRGRDRIQRADALPDVRLRSVNELLDRTDANIAHASHVSRLALQILEDVAQSARIEPEARQILHVAALLHDIGLHVEHRRHHKHSYYLIQHGGLRGFTGREIDLISAVARYHRSAVPKRKHPEFKALAKSDQRLVRVLAAILRIADGLDRGHNQIVEAVHCQLQPGRATFHIRTWHDAELELWGARRKADLFASVFEVEPRFTLETPQHVDDRSEPVAEPEPSLQAH
jgi:exopolyphosphatase/guanosine-5'-triphosphate,3'-diphosphate pyrophosphatase